MKRQKLTTRRILLRTEIQRDTARAALENLPLDDEDPIEIVFQERKETRNLSQNAAYWAGPLRDISEQACVDGQQFSPEVWHQYCKQQFLPEEFDEALCKGGYVKWEYAPNGDRVLVGSTTQLTKKGFSEYRQQVEAMGASLGVMFHAVDRGI